MREQDGVSVSHQKHIRNLKKRYNCRKDQLILCEGILFFFLLFFLTPPALLFRRSLLLNKDYCLDSDNNLSKERHNL